MNNFEERKFLNYLEKLLPYTDTNDYNFDSVFDFFCDEFKVDRKPYPIDKDNCLNVDTRKKQERFAKLLKKDVIRLKEKIKPQNTLLEKQLLTIKKIYRLNNDEYEMLLYLALKEFNKVFRKYFDCLYENSFATFTRVYSIVNHLVFSLWFVSIVFSFSTISSVISYWNSNSSNFIGFSPLLLI